LLDAVLGESEGMHVVHHTLSDSQTLRESDNIC
jgi:hypothetical protein